MPCHGRNGLWLRLLGRCFQMEELCLPGNGGSFWIPHKEKLMQPISRASHFLIFGVTVFMLMTFTMLFWTNLPGEALTRAVGNPVVLDASFEIKMRTNIFVLEVLQN